MTVFFLYNDVDNRPKSCSVNKIELSINIMHIIQKSHVRANSGTDWIANSCSARCLLRITVAKWRCTLARKTFAHKRHYLCF